MNSVDNGLTPICVDDMIGEAVIVLLKSGGPITTTALLNQLTTMATQSIDWERKDACLQGILDIKQSISNNHHKRSQFLRKQRSLFESGKHLH